MNTKQITWQFFTRIILKLAKTHGKKTLDFDELMTLLKQFGHIYDPRTMRNYIDCMLSNGWLGLKEENPLDVLGTYVVNSVWKYKRMTFIINENAQYDPIDEDKALAEWLKGE